MNLLSKYHLLGIFLFLSLISFSQNVSVIKITDLQKRINNNSDTTYIVNFWASWCVPCIKELPDFDSIHLNYSSQKVKVLLVTLDFIEDKETKVIPFMKKKNVRSEVLLLNEVNGNYFIPLVSDKWTGAIPATLILNNKKQYKEFYEKKLNYAFLQQEIISIQKK